MSLRLGELEAREAEYQVRLAEYETLLPSEAEVPTLLEEVAFAAIETDVKIVNFAPLPEVFGDVLPETTGDERHITRRSDDEQWYRENRPPHHG